jgi:hypothetical protein
MKGMVDELQSMVGGSSKAKRADSHSDDRPAPKSAKPHKAIASAISKLKSKVGPAKKSGKPMAEAVIPLDDDQQLADF